MNDRFSADPNVVFMTAVLDDLAAGRLLVPRFQRPLVWRWDQRRDLLNSIYEGLPIGALMIWIGDSDRVERYSRLGPYVLPVPKPGENRFLLDGVQRVSTLFGALRASSDWDDIDVESDETVKDFSILVDLDSKSENERFIREIDVIPSARSDDPSRYLPLRIVLDSRELLRFQRGVPAGLEHRIDSSDLTAGAFRQYKIPVITLSNASLEVVTKSFQRVNSRGTPINEMHMINALTYSEDFDLLQEERRLRREVITLPSWQNIDQDIVLRALKLELGVDFYSPSPEQASRKLKANPMLLEKVFRGINKSAIFLRSGAKIDSPALVPYRLQVISMASILSGNSALGVEELLSWFWVTTYAEVFAASARQSENAIADLQRFAETGKFQWTLRPAPLVQPLLGRKTDFRSARGKALAIALARRVDEVCLGYGADVLNSYGKEAFCSVAQQPHLRGRAGLRFILKPQELPSFKHRLTSGKITSEECIAHIISDKSIEHINADDFNAFCDQREQDIFRYEEKYVFGPSFRFLGLGFAFSDKKVFHED